MNAYWKLGLALVLVLATAWATHYYDDATKQAAVDKEVVTRTAGLKAISDTATKAAVDQGLQLAAATSRLAVIDKEKLQEKNDALDENQHRADAALADATKRLRVHASCPAAAASSHDLPAATTTAGVDDGATVELAPDTGQDVYRIRAGIISDQKALTGLQAYVLSSCQPQPGPAP